MNDAFFLSISLLGVTFVYLVLLCPESRQPTGHERIASSGDSIPFKTSPTLVLRRYLHRFVTALIIPIAMFAPRPIPGQPSRKNYNLTLLGAGLFLYLVSTVSSSFFSMIWILMGYMYQGVYSSKYLYAQHVYTWTTAQVFNMLSAPSNVLMKFCSWDITCPFCGFRELLISSFSFPVRSLCRFDFRY